MDPTTTKGRRTRDRIVEAAAHLMHLQGVRATSVDHVLEAAGVGKGQFYHYFDSRADLEAAVVERFASAQPESAAPDDILRTWDDVDRWFDVVYALYAETGFRGGCPLGTMASEVADRDAALRERLEAAFRRKCEHLARGFDVMQSTGIMDPGVDALDLAHFVVAVVQGGLVLARVAEDGAPLRTALAHARAHVRGFATDAV